LLRASGYAGFSVDAVAERTGIAKTTIYRRWPSKAGLVAAAIAPLAPPSGDAKAILDDTASVLALLSGPDAEALDVIRAVVAPRLLLLRDLLGNEAADEKIGALLTRLLF
jgi:AcrR family transcriptional regulator